VLAVWESGAGTTGAVQQTRARTEVGTRGSNPARRPVGLRSESPVGIIDGLKRFVRYLISSAEELAFLVFFVAFVGFAIFGFMLIYLG